jgi:cephalosporin hydroxylase
MLDATDPHESAPLLSGDALRQAADRYAEAVTAKVAGEQGGFFSIFDKWFAHTRARFLTFDPSQSWEDGVREEVQRDRVSGAVLAWNYERLQYFLDRWEQGRLVEYAQREAYGARYVAPHGTEFADDVFLTAQGVPSLLQWRGVPLMKTVFDFAVYPMLLAELRPLTVFEIGSGLGASARWLADHLAMLGVRARVHSVDLHPPAMAAPGVMFHRGDCAAPASLFPPALLASAAHPWLVIEDAHQNVEAVLQHVHRHLQPGDYLIVEDSDIKRDTLRRFIGAHPGAYKVDCKYTDYFGRNATCAADSIFVRMPDAAPPPA